MKSRHHSRNLAEPVINLIARNPSAAAGSCTFALAFALVASNAFFSQPGSHPDPIWSTRDAFVTQSVTPSQPEIRVVQTTQVRPRVAPVPEARPGTATAPVASPLLTSLQQALTATGDYSGEIDGLIGPRTRSAISAFQKRTGLTQTGEPSEELLRLALQASPPARTEAAGVSASGTDPLGSIIASQAPNAAGFDARMVTLVQRGLANSGIGEIEIDGIYGSQTRQAIEAFQRRHSLEVTGIPDAGLIEKMIDLGALSSG